MAATQLWQAYTGTMQTPGFADHRDKEMAGFLLRPDIVELVNGQFFSDTDEQTMSHKLTTHGDELALPTKAEDTDPRPYDNPPEGYDKTITLYTYARAVKITRTLVSTDLSGKLQSNAMSGLPKANRRLVELAMANVINTGTATAGSDGSNVFGTDHYLEDPSAGTWSNYETAAALSPTSVKAAEINMLKRKNARGHVMGINLDALVIPVDLKHKAFEIANSPQNPNDALNAVNAMKGRFRVVENKYLTDTNGFGFWGDLPEEAWGFHIVFHTRPMVMRLGYPSAEYPHIVAGWTSYAQFGVGGSQVKNMHWNIGA
jgi:hypothetical protein